MATMFGRFEIQSEISKSGTSLIYKALDCKTNQIVALKTQSLQPLGERAKVFVDTLLAEGERTRELANQNIVVLYGAGEIEGQFCAAMEYIQGNSIATMLARKEGFSIWDLLDISRQVCAALEYADTLGVAHLSLEPAKIMVQWDGLVKILGYGISNMSLIHAESGNGLGPLMPYCSPEQIRGEAIDQRSNLFTLGTILYEMVAGRKAFAAEDPVVLVGQVENEMPTAPDSVNPKAHAGVSAVIMRALAKDPAGRYQTARALVEDLEQCKDNSKKATAEPKKTASAAAAKIDPAARAAASAKFVSALANASERPSTSPNKVRASVPSTSVSAQTASPQSMLPPSMPVPTQAMRAAAGASSCAGAPANSPLEAGRSSTGAATSGARLIEDPDNPSKIDHGSVAAAPEPVLSAAALDEESETYSPRVAVDPLMAGGAASAATSSFSEIDELPPLKEPVFTALPLSESGESSPTSVPDVALAVDSKPDTKKEEEKPKIQPRQVARRALKEVATIPPRLILFSTLGGVAVVSWLLPWHCFCTCTPRTTVRRLRPARSRPQPRNSPRRHSRLRCQFRSPPRPFECQFRRLMRSRQ